MPNEPAEPVQVEFTQEFKRNLRALAKKYRHIRSGVQPVIDQLQAGEVVGEQVRGTRYTIFKVRAWGLRSLLHRPVGRVCVRGWTCVSWQRTDRL